MKNHPYAPFLHKVEKPARYIGGEYNAVIKDWSDVKGRMALCFPDVYDIGMSHLGTKILYSVINKSDDLYMERAFCPWPDMEAQLREHNLPILSLETHRPLADFDVVGFSLQYEMTFTNIFTCLELGGIPLRAENRTLEHPLVVAGGPVATHPEPIAPFFDVILVGDAEERLPRLLRHYAEMKEEGKLTRTEMLVELAKEGGVYCPELYEREMCERSNLLYVSKPKYDGVPDFVERAFLDDISRYKFPNDSPVAVAEAIFDRMSIEIARGCTEGCRFCQAGMIYRPVRERDPDEVIDTVMTALDQSGYDEAAITSLSTADYSCISPLIKKLMERLRPRKVGLGISSLRAYGLDEDLLDEISSVKATGLTFAPEAGSQRMRDVVNKNIDENDIYTTCHRVFSRGWRKIKLYFMIGLPTEENEDVIAIAKMGKQALEIGKLYKNRVEVVVSVSSHVPKPHTPFQWCAMDNPDELVRKQDILRKLSKKWGFIFRHHEFRVSHLEGIISRADIRAADLLENVWRKGARFDGWDELLNWEIWNEALDEWEEQHGVDRFQFLGTIPVDARLPWDHIDVGLEDGFLEKEYKKSLGNKLSPPCGKPLQAKVHHTNLEDALAETKKLVCYHCGIACDLSHMRTERLDFLTKLGAEKRPEPNDDPNAHQNAMRRFRKGKTPHNFNQGERLRYRIRYTKLSPLHMQGHQDINRLLPQVMRRAGLPLFYSEGFRPKPVLSFGPALSLGIQSTAEYADITLHEEIPVAEIFERLNEFAPEGLIFTGVRRVGEQDSGLSKILRAVEYVVVPEHQNFVDAAKYLGVPLESASELTESEKANLLEKMAARCEEVLASESFPITVTRKDKSKVVDLRSQLLSVSIESTDNLPKQAGFAPGQLMLQVRLKEADGPSIRAVEVFEALFESDVLLHRVVRTGGFALHKKEGTYHEPLDFSSRGEEVDVQETSLEDVEQKLSSLQNQEPIPGATFSV